MAKPSPPLYLLRRALLDRESLSLNDLIAIHLHCHEESHGTCTFMALSRRKVEPLVRLNSVFRHAVPFLVELAEQVLSFGIILRGRMLKERSRLSVALRNPLSLEIELRQTNPRLGVTLFRTHR